MLESRVTLRIFSTKWCAADTQNLAGRDVRGMTHNKLTQSVNATEPGCAELPLVAVNGDSEGLNGELRKRTSLSNPRAANCMSGLHLLLALCHFVDNLLHKNNANMNSLGDIGQELSKQVADGIGG